MKKIQNSKVKITSQNAKVKTQNANVKWQTCLPARQDYMANVKTF